MQAAPREKVAPTWREPGIDSPSGSEPEGTSGRNLEPFLLLELQRSPSYGYDLIRRLGDYGFRRGALQTTVIYKLLRALEEAGAIRSTWTTRESGPARRYYQLSPEGSDLLERRLQQLRRHVERVQRLLREHEALVGGQGLGARGEVRDPPAPHPKARSLNPAPQTPPPGAS